MSISPIQNIDLRPINRIDLKYEAIAVVVVNIAVGILMDIYTGDPQTIHTKAFSVIAGMGLLVCFFYSFMNPDHSKKGLSDQTP